MAFVNACPTTKAEVNIAAKRNGCRNGTNGRSSYMCIPNKEKTTLVEFCYNENIGIHEKGNCLEASLGRITEHSCSNFPYGCPDSDYFKDELYKYPACQHINTNNHCYVMDPLCQSKTPIVETKDSGVFYACFTVCGIAFLIIGAILLYLYLKQRSKKGNQDKNEKDEEDKEPLIENMVKNEEHQESTNRNINQETEDKDQHTVNDNKDKEENAQNTVEDGKNKEENAQNTVKEGKDTEENAQNTVKEGKDMEENAHSTVKEGKDTEENAQKTVKDGKDKEENGGGQMSNVKTKFRTFFKPKRNSKTKKK